MRGATGRPMGLEAIDHALGLRAEERDRIAGDLLDLDDHPSHKLLTGMSPSGETGRRWDQAQVRYRTLWWLFDAYRRALDQAARLRAVHRPDLAALTALLTGPWVELKPGGVPVEKRSLLRADGERVTLDALVTRMDQAYREVAETVAEVDAAWGTLLTGLDAADAARRAAGELARDLDAHDPELGRLDAEAARLRAAITADPLGSLALRAELDELASAAAARRSALEQAVTTRDEYAERVRRLGERVAQVADAEREALRARDLVLVKIAAPALPAMPDQSPALRDRLAALATLGGRWLEMAARLGEMERAAEEALTRARGLADSIGGLIGRRDELRGRLSAYQAKAVRLGHAEDRTLAGLYAAARDLLWTAPCDLRRATVAVTEYQRAITRIGAAG